jgi:hypothetical protein
MSGLINAPLVADGAAPSGLHNALLQQTEQALEARLKPDNRADYMKIVVAGLHIALDKGSAGFMAKLRTSQDPISDCARGAASLVLIMRKEAKGQMPMQAGIPAGLTLMLHGLDFIDRAKITPVAEAQLDRATKIFVNELFHKQGITPGMLQHATNRVHQIVQDPILMEKIKLKAGITKHPDAATPTPLPPGPTQ